MRLAWPFVLAPSVSPLCFRRYTDAVDSHFVASVLHALPKQYESILKQIDDGDDDNRSFDMSLCPACANPSSPLTCLPVPEPNLNSHVILRVKEDRKNVELGDESCVSRPIILATRSLRPGGTWTRAPS